MNAHTPFPGGFVMRHESGNISICFYSDNATTTFRLVAAQSEALLAALQQEIGVRVLPVLEGVVA